MNELKSTMDSPIGRLLLIGVERNGTVLLDSVRFTDDSTVHNGESLADVRAQLDAYFAGSRTAFDVHHTDRGTPFQQRVWAEVDAIPYGSTITYGELAARVGAGRDRVRAVAAAVGANPLLVVRPCHRVIGAGGALTGYAGGVERKRSLLVLEGAVAPVLV
jgi:methylated-DNA-[protein]-cysteine S-methyltransferase